MKTINQLTKDCLNKNFNEFYDEQKILFKAKDNFYDASKLDLKKIPEKIIKFKGVLVMLDKENNIKRSSAHGKFRRDNNTKIKKYFSPFNPIRDRWTPFFISLEHNKIAFGYKQSAAVSLAFGINFVKSKEPKIILISDAETGAPHKPRRAHCTLHWHLLLLRAIDFSWSNP